MKYAAPPLPAPFSLRQFLVLGLLGCLAGVWLGILNVIFLTLIFPGLYYQGRFLLVALWGLGGIIAGAVQGSFLRPIRRLALVWLPLSGAGWFAVGLLDSLGPLAQSSTGKVIGVSLLYGTIAAFPQWLLLQRSFWAAVLWLPLSASTWTILGLILAWQSHRFYETIKWISDQVLR